MARVHEAVRPCEPDEQRAPKCPDPHRVRGSIEAVCRPVVLALAMSLVLFAASSGIARERITFDEGGLVQPRLKWVATAEGPIIIDGLCLSACTLVLARHDVCVTRRAILGFHQAFHRTTGKPAPEATAGMYALYPPAIRAWIDRHGGLTNRPLLLSGEELRAMVKPCEETPIRAN